MTRPTIRPARIKKIRRRLGLTQLQLADRMGVSEDTVTSWENDRSNPLGPAVILLKQLEIEKMGLTANRE